ITCCVNLKFRIVEWWEPVSTFEIIKTFACSRHLELCVRSGNSQRAGQCEKKTEVRNQAVDAGNHWFIPIVTLAAKPVVQKPVIFTRDNIGNAVVCSDQDGCANSVIVIDCFECLQEFTQRRCVKRSVSSFTIDREQHDPFAALLERKVVKLICQHLKFRIPNLRSASPAAGFSGRRNRKSPCPICARTSRPAPCA